MNKKMIAALGLCLCSIASFAFADTGNWKYPPGKDVSSRFAGTVYRNDLIDLDPTYNVPQTNCISFEPGSRSAWHVHGGMVVVGLDGVGLLQIDGQPAMIIRKGDVAYCPPGETHWHGAAPDSSFAHLAVSPAGKHTVEWYGFLDKKEYKKAAVK